MYIYVLFIVYLYINCKYVNNKFNYYLAHIIICLFLFSFRIHWPSGWAIIRGLGPSLVNMRLLPL